MEVTGLDEAIADLALVTEQTDAAVSKLVVGQGALLQTDVRRRASTGFHRPGVGHIPGTGPGPNVATGDYRRSITRKTTRRAHFVSTLVSTRAAQNLRLEFGFFAMDSLGRRYRQPAFPHWRPAGEAAEVTFEAGVDVIAAAIPTFGSP